MVCALRNKECGTVPVSRKVWVKYIYSLLVWEGAIGSEIGSVNLNMIIVLDNFTSQKAMHDQDHGHGHAYRQKMSHINW